MKWDFRSTTNAAARLNNESILSTVNSVLIKNPGSNPKRDVSEVGKMKFPLSTIFDFSNLLIAMRVDCVIREFSSSISLLYSRRNSAIGDIAYPFSIPARTVGCLVVCWSGEDRSGGVDGGREASGPLGLMGPTGARGGCT